MNLPAHLSAVFADYLAAADPAASGIPSPDRLPRLPMDAAGVKARPFIEITITESDEPDGHQQLRKLEMRVTLKAGIEPAAGDGPGSKRMSREQAETLAGKIRQRLLDMGSLKAWLATLPESRRAGWALQKPPRLLNEERELDEDSRALDIAIPARLLVLVSAGL